ncbi:hypothetical protein QYM36_016266 [Artemia franciscana]|uniref:Transmembrane protein 62 n=1 Tax=Artemia franciscana TaxID=6661 RepID=A0AA88HIA7_ARTSF|nr:hypothetical protein QYM36_016266 [Artemia franciscana]
MQLQVAFCCLLAIVGILLARIIAALKVHTNPIHDREVKDGEILGNRKGSLFYFVQITDIHISIFRDPNRIPDLWTFCDENLKVIKPPVVIASGDLTDATREQPMGSQQYEEEWRQYSNSVRKCKNHTKAWLDIRGNHDTFNVPSSNSSINYFRNYSAQGRLHSYSYMYTTKEQGYTVNFIAVDGTTEPGTIKPYNFFGIISPEGFAVLEKMKRDAAIGNATFWFGHYPTSTLLSPSPGMRELMNDGMAYLNGHLHTFFMMVPKMHTLHHSGLIELELGDWKDHRIYRILAIDNGLFSFVDLRVHDWPAILITNPKDSMYMQPTKEPLWKMAKSTHIRILIFSKSAIRHCQVKIDDADVGQCLQSDGPLFVLPWNPQDYSKGLHKLEVSAMDSDLQTRNETIIFSLDGSREPFPFGGRFALMSDAVTTLQEQIDMAPGRNMAFLFGDFNTQAQCLFGFLFAAWILPLCILRICHYRILGGAFVKPRLSNDFFGRLARNFWIAAATDRIFIFIMLGMVYLLIGPWFVGELADGLYGVIFLWGTFVGNVYQPGSLSYFYGATHSYSALDYAGSFAE